MLQQFLISTSNKLSNENCSILSWLHKLSMCIMCIITFYIVGTEEDHSVSNKIEKFGKEKNVQNTELLKERFKNKSLGD